MGDPTLIEIKSGLDLIQEVHLVLVEFLIVDPCEGCIA